MSLQNCNYTRGNFSANRKQHEIGAESGCQQPENFNGRPAAIEGRNHR